MAQLSNKRRDLGFVTVRRQIRYADGTWEARRQGRSVDGSSARTARVPENLSSRGDLRSRPRILNCSPHNVDLRTLRARLCDDDFPRYWQPVNTLLCVVVTGEKPRDENVRPHDSESRSLLAPDVLYQYTRGIERSTLFRLGSRPRVTL